MRLSSDGFKYPRMAFRNTHGRVLHPHADPNGWMALKEAYVAEKLPALVDLAKQLGLVALVLYNKRRHRIDILFKAAPPLPSIMFSVYL